MDPLTQGAIGAALPQATRRAKHVRIAAALGFLSGMAADLDVLIRSDTDPLLFLDYHRQFTHSIVFMPVGGLICAVVLHAVLRVLGRGRSIRFPETVLYCTLGYATHALLDTATTYGTMLFWPFSDTRYAWSIISIVDPLFTLPVLALLCAAWIKRRPAFARAGLIWAVAYLAFGALQHGNARAAASDLAQARGHVPVRLDVKPSFANLLLWKSVYEADGAFHVDAVRVGIAPMTTEGARVPKLRIERDFPWLDPASQQARDIARFQAFSDDYAARDPDNPLRVIDVRYSFIPNRTASLWAVEVTPDAEPDAHAAYVTDRRDARQRLGVLWGMLWRAHPSN